MSTNGTIPDTRDRYQRLTENIEIFADDENVASAPPPFDVQGLRAFVGSIVEERLLDGLSDHDADIVGFLSGVDFFQGPQGWRGASAACSTTSSRTPARRPMTRSRSSTRWRPSCT